MSRKERHYIITYDIADQKRWRRVYKLLRGYGSWVQLSVFQLQLSGKRYQELTGRLQEIIHHEEDHVLCIDIGAAGTTRPKITSLGKLYIPLNRDTLIV